MKRDKIGRIVLSKKNFFLKYLWGMNFWRFLIPKIWRLIFDDSEAKKPHYPKNICSLFWGSVLGAPLCWLLTLFCSPFFLLCVAILWIVYILVLIIGFLLGYMPKRSESEMFHQYMRYGKKDEKRLPVAPWHVIVAAFVVWLLTLENFVVSKGMAGFFVWFLRQIIWIPTHSVGLMVLSGIALVVLLILFFRSTAWQVCREFIKDKKDKTCTQIVYKNPRKRRKTR